MSQARYVMIGGFLGAGKTTAIVRMAEHLTGDGLRVGLITNDQSFGLVDTALIGSRGFPVEEITGGCFCCKFNSLVEASERLSTAGRPNVFLAEPVGSCTDLKATVDYPMRRMYGDDFSIAPLSVMVDPIRAARILGLDKAKSFSPKVVYIYLKQLEEADVIVVNKVDLLAAPRLAELQEALGNRFPRARLVAVSARHGAGMEPWLTSITREEMGSGEAMDVDYDLYAEGEALLGWLNGTLQVSAEHAFDGNAFLLDTAREIRRRLQSGGAEIAHLKMTLTPGEDGRDIGVANLVRNDFEPELSHALQESLESGELIVNLRAEAAPEVLRSTVLEALRAVAGAIRVRLELEHLEGFRPGRPVPTHRLARA